MVLRLPEWLQTRVPWIVFAASLLVTLAGWVSTDRYVRQQRRDLFTDDVNYASGLIAGRIRNYEQVLLGAAGLVDASNEVTRDEWQAYYLALRLEERFPGVQGLGFVAYVAQADKARFVQTVRQDVFSYFRIQPDGERPDYAVLQHMEPWNEINKKLIGFDLYTDRHRRQAMVDSRDTASPRMTRRLTLLRDRDQPEQAGVVMYMPVFRSGLPIETIAERRAALLGYINVPLRMSNLMAGLFSQRVRGELDFTLYDGDSVSPEHLLYDSVQHVTKSPPKPGDALTSVERVELAGQVWTVVFQARRAFIDSTSSSLPMVVLFGGIALDLMLFALIAVFASARRLAVNEAMRVTAELREREAMFRLVVEASPNGVLMVEPEGRIKLANSAVERIFGYEAGGLVDVSVASLLPESVRALYDQDRVAERTADMRAVGLRKLTGLQRGGGLVALEVALRPVETIEGPMVLASVQDITSREEAERQLRNTKALLQSVIDSASDFSIIATNPRGVITVFNTGAERMLGYAAAEVVGQITPEQFHLHEEVVERGAALSEELGVAGEGFEVFVARARKFGHDVREWTYVRKDGSRLQVHLFVTPIMGGDGDIEGFIGIAYDVTARKEAEEALARAKELAELNSRSKSEFLANMSHEIRTPLNAVLGMAQLLSLGSLSEEQKEYLRMIEVSGKALLGILNDILDFSKIEAGRMEILEAPFRLSDTLETLGRIMAVSAAEKDLELVIHVAPDVPDALIGDALRLQQILINLAGNAIKFTERGAVVVKVARDLASAARIGLRFAVVDTGIGMNTTQIASLFASFSQVDTLSTRRFGGTGLGLAISKRLVELMGGRIEVSSEPGQGSSFAFTALLQTDTTHPNVRHAFLDGLHIQEALLVDAQEASALAVEAAAAHLDFRCVRCVDAMAAGGLVAAQHSRFELLLINWTGRDSGRATLLPLLRGQAGDKTPIILAMATASGRETLKKDPLYPFLDGVLVKPVTATGLQDQLLKILDRRQGALSLPKVEDGSVAIGASLKGMRFLLVEDNAINRMVAIGMLERVGAVIDAVGNGQEAVEQLRSHPTAYACVLMDVQMPVLDGIAATRLIREELQLTDLPIVAMSAGVLQSQRQECEACGMNAFLAKPLDLGLVLETLHGLVGVKSPGGSLLDAQDEHAQPSAACTRLRAITTLDWDDAFLRLGRSWRLMEEIVRRFCDDAEVFPAEAERLLRNDLPSGRRLFHTMKASAATIGATALARLAADGERAAEAGDAEVGQTITRQMAAQFRVLVPQLREALADSAARSAAEAIVVDAPSRQALISLLDEHDMAAVELFDRLRAGFAAEYAPDDVRHLDLCISELAFAAAAERLRALTVLDPANPP